MAKGRLIDCTKYGTVRAVIWHLKAKVEISAYPEDVRKELGYLIYRLQLGEVLPMPHSRPMKSVAMGASELRVRGPDGNYRVFYYTKSPRGILVFHAFVKKSEQTPESEVAAGKSRLRELLEE